MHDPVERTEEAPTPEEVARWLMRRMGVRRDEQEPLIAAIASALRLARQQGREEGLEEAAQLAEKERDYFQDGARDVRFSITRAPKWRDGPIIAAFIRTLKAPAAERETT